MARFRAAQRGGVVALGYEAMRDRMRGVVDERQERTRPLFTAEECRGFLSPVKGIVPAITVNGVKTILSSGVAIYFTTTGTITVTVNVPYTFSADGIGGGGGGGGDATSDSGGGGGEITGGGGGGGGGSFRATSVTLVPGKTYNFIVGTGGAPGTETTEGTVAGAGTLTAIYNLTDTTYLANAGGGTGGWSHDFGAGSTPGGVGGVGSVGSNLTTGGTGGQGCVYAGAGPTSGTSSDGGGGGGGGSSVHIAPSGNGGNGRSTSGGAGGGGFSAGFAQAGGNGGGWTFNGVTCGGGGGGGRTQTANNAVAGQQGGIKLLA